MARHAFALFYGLIDSEGLNPYQPVDNSSAEQWIEIFARWEGALSDLGIAPEEVPALLGEGLYSDRNRQRLTRVQAVRAECLALLLSEQRPE